MNEEYLPLPDPAFRIAGYPTKDGAVIWYRALQIRVDDEAALRAAAAEHKVPGCNSGEVLVARGDQTKEFTFDEFFQRLGFE